jgi:hypothetical protein
MTKPVTPSRLLLARVELALIVALALAFVPYVLMRVLLARGVRWWLWRQKDLAW